MASKVVKFHRIKPTTVANIHAFYRVTAPSKLVHAVTGRVYISQTRSQGTDTVPRSRFDDLADRWEKETAHLSSISRRRSHTYFSLLATIGPRVIPWALERIKSGKPFWFLVLEEIVTDGPTINYNGNMKRACSEWLKWGKQHGHVS